MRTATTILFALVLLAGCAADDTAADPEPAETAEGSEDESAQDDDEAAQDDDGDEPADGDAVTIVGFSFDPDTISVEAGDTLVWTNEDSARHNVTADDDSFASENLAEGETFSHTFDEPGTFDYVCTLHSGMTATVEVG